MTFFCLEGEMCLGFFLKHSESVLGKAFWLDFQTRCTKTPQLSSESKRVSFKIKQLLECKEPQYLAEMYSQNFQKPFYFHSPLNSMPQLIYAVHECADTHWAICRVVCVLRLISTADSRTDRLRVLLSASIILLPDPICRDIVIALDEISYYRLFGTCSQH